MTEEEARQYAIDWQNWASKQSLSYGELADKVEQLFEVIYEACPGVAIKAKDGYVPMKELHLEHLLITAEKRGKRLMIDSVGKVYLVNEIKRLVYICKLDIDKNISDQSPETLDKIAEVIV
jgi:hypothetical protein